MRAAFYSNYGDPQVLSVGEVTEPKVGPDSVLVAIRATSVNPVDWKIMAGYLEGILDVHFPVVPGWDVSGVVEAVGPAVEDFKVGDRVLGYVRMDFVQHGSFAERIAAPFRTLAHLPASIGFSDAAALPLAGLTAYQGLVHALKLQQGETVLISGGAGGVGTFAIQIARALGARVITTGSKESAEFLASLGAEPILYGSDDLEDTVRKLAPSGLDGLLDLYGGSDLVALTPVVNDQRRIASVADASVRARGGHYVFVRPDRDDLDALVRLVESGSIRPIISETYDLDHASDAFASNTSGHTRGKIVVTI